MVNGERGHRPAGPRRTQAERSASTRAALLAAGRRLFAERGFSGAGREEIVAAAGVTRGAMYHHFTDKTDLFRAVAEEVEEELVGRIATAAMAASAPLEQLRLGCHAYLDAALDPGLRRICIIDAPAVLPAAVHREISERYGLGMVREVLQAAADGGVLADSRQSVELLSHVLLAAITAAAQYVALADDPAAARAEAGSTIDSLVAGLGPTAP